jgi:hypothetical protein
VTLASSQLSGGEECEAAAFRYRLTAPVRKMPSWPRIWANFSLLWLYSHRHGQLASFGPTYHLSRYCHHYGMHLPSLHITSPCATCRPQLGLGRIRFVLPLIHFIPYVRTYSVHLFLKRQCDRTLPPARRARGVRSRWRPRPTGPHPRTWGGRAHPTGTAVPSQGGDAAILHGCWLALAVVP